MRATSLNHASGVRATSSGSGKAAELDEGVRHPNGRRPRAVGRADRFNRIFKYRRAREETSGTRSGPAQALVAGNHRIEGREVVVESKHACDRALDGFPDRARDTPVGDDLKGTIPLAEVD